MHTTLEISDLRYKMNKFPKAIELIIWDYKKQMEDCEVRMHYALRMFMNIQTSGFFVRNEITTSRGRSEAWFSVCKIISEASGVIDELLTEFTKDNMERLFYLQNKMDNRIIHCIMLSSLEPLIDTESNSSQDDDTETNVPHTALL